MFDRRPKTTTKGEGATTQCKGSCTEWGFGQRASGFGHQASNKGRDQVCRCVESRPRKGCKDRAMVAGQRIIGQARALGQGSGARALGQGLWGQGFGARAGGFRARGKAQKHKSMYRRNHGLQGPVKPVLLVLEGRAGPGQPCGRARRTIATWPSTCLQKTRSHAIADTVILQKTYSSTGCGPCHYPVNGDEDHKLADSVQQSLKDCHDALTYD